MRLNSLGHARARLARTDNDKAAYGLGRQMTPDDTHRIRNFHGARKKFAKKCVGIAQSRHLGSAPTEELIMNATFKRSLRIHPNRGCDITGVSIRF
jgi:hypothetical protein